MQRITLVHSIVEENRFTLHQFKTNGGKFIYVIESPGWTSPSQFKVIDPKEVRRILSKHPILPLGNRGNPSSEGWALKEFMRGLVDLNEWINYHNRMCGG